uniref:GATA-type domain-containing protein n=1 Tax=Meloidogyne enterolobii TaxID=390850 RepID=A0A6V7U263_MELEN|nr:unnamed protein product [Meloidogyne enterolobii]
MKSPKCKNCGAEHADLYRRDQTNGDCYCNACGLYRKLHGINRPIVKPEKKPGNIDLDTRQCINCGTTSTTLWRREHKSGDYLCNDCGIYQREHGGENRPIEKAEKRQMDNSDVKIDIPQYKDVYITEKEGDLPKLIPTDEDGSLALDTVAVSFPGVIGLGYKCPETGLFRQLNMNPDETFSEPVDGWENKTFIAICKKNDTVLKIELDELKEDFIGFKSDFNLRLESEIKASERRIKNDILRAVQISVLVLQAVLVGWNIILFLF